MKSEICIEISERYEIHFIEIAYETNHVHFLVQSIAKQLLQRHPEIELKL